MKINEKKTFSYFNYSFQNLIDFKLSITSVQESFLGTPTQDKDLFSIANANKNNKRELNSHGHRLKIPILMD